MKEFFYNAHSYRILNKDSAVYWLCIILTSLVSFNFALADKSELRYWSFDENKGNRVYESAQKVTDKINFVFNQARFKPNSDPYWRDNCIRKACLRFDGYSTYLEANSLPKNLEKTGFTLSVWVAPHAFEWADGLKYSGVISQLDESNKTGFIFGIQRHGSFGLKLGFGNKFINIKSTKHRVKVDQWSHIAASFDPSTNKVKLFLNAKQIADSQLPESVKFQMSDVPLRIGKHNFPLAVAGVFEFHTYNGMMDELKIYDSILSPSEVQKIAKVQVPEVSVEQSMIGSEVLLKDKHRPQYHLIPNAHWMNEPHAPMYYKGKYHIFYQKNPHGPFWHQIHWGHWVSEDMVNWKELPMAIYPEPGYVVPDGVWSGSATYDKNGKPVLFFTAGNDSDDPKERVGLAVPDDLNDPNLINWSVYPDTVLEQQKGWGTYRQFRDPFTWKDPQKDRWYSLITSGSGELAGSGTALLFASDNLIDWDYKGPIHTTDRGKYPFVGTTWELPVFLPLGKGTDGKMRHIFMFNSHGVGSVREVYYWIGFWDADTFKFTPEHEEPRHFDLGNDHFTGPSGFVDPKTGRSIVFSIAQGERTPHADFAAGWAHNGGLPVHMWLGKDNTLRLGPIDELKNLRDKTLINMQNASTSAVANALKNIRGDMLEIEMIAEIDSHSEQKVGLIFRSTEDAQEHTKLYYDTKNQRLEIDRRKHSVNPDTRGKRIDGGKITLENNLLKLRLFLDKSMVEAYVNQRKSLTSRVYPASLDAVHLKLLAGNLKTIKSFKLWSMKSIHQQHTDTQAKFETGVKIDINSTWKSGLSNHDFRNCNLDGWEVVEGSAFSSKAVTNLQRLRRGLFFNPSTQTPGKCHFWGYATWSGDKATGMMKSKEFVLGGDGWINFLIAGGRSENIYIALMKGEQELMRATGNNYEEYRRVFWDASEYLGEKLYLKVVDNHSGSWGHINLDDIHIPTLSKRGGK